MSSPDESRDDHSGIHLEATAIGQGVVNQAGRDQHIHYSGGARRLLPGGDGAGAVCPYPGLASFTVEQAGWFFGRDRLTATLVSRLDACLTEGGPVMVVSASGAGKSSLLRAGLLPKIAAGALTAPGSRRWPRVVFAPGAHPLREAAAALAAACPGGGAAPAEPGAGDLDALLAEASGPPGPGGRTVLVVDQFEQLFRLCEDEEERSAFISWLCDAARASEPGGPAALVACAVRADFYLDCTRYPQLRQALQDNQLIVGAMTPGELREAITCPAEAAELDLDPGLTELLLADLRAGGRVPGEASLTADDGAGRLPLLAHALQATWRQRHGSILTVEGYRAAGGIEHAIAETAERVYRRWEGDAEREVRGLFLRLVKIGDDGGEDIRRPVPRLALLAAAGTAAAKVIDDYTASRLVTQSRETVQITHEALLRAWPRLAGWLDEDRAGQLARQQVEDDAAAWDLAGRDTSRLYRGARLASAVAWAAGHSPDLTAAARDFLEASRRRVHLAAIALRAGVAVLAALTVATTVFSVVAFQQRSAAVSQRDLAVYNQVLAEAGQLAASDPAAAAQLLVAAYRMRPGTSLRSSLVSTENQPLPALVHTATSVDAVAVSSAGRTAATLSNGYVTLWNITDVARPWQTGQPLLPGVGEPASSVAISPDGRTLATGDEDGSIALWDISSPSHPVGELTVSANQDSNSVEQVAFSPDGRILASRDYGGNGSTIITLWGISAARHPRELTTLAVPAGTFWQSVAFSANGRTLVGVFMPAGDAGGGILLWDITDPSRPRELGQALSPLGTGTRSAAFSPDGSILAGGSAQGTVTLWDVSRPAHPQVLSPGLSAGSDAVISAMFSTDGQTLTAVNDDGTARQWDVASPADPRPISRLASTGNTNLQAAAFSSNGRILITGSFNGIIGFSPVPRAIGTTYFEGDSAPYGINPDGELLAAARPGGGFSLWNVSSPSQPRLAGQVPATDSSVNSLAFSPDGRTLAVGTTNFGPSDIEGKREGIALWDITDPARPRQVGGLLNGNGTGYDAAAFSPDGRTLAVADNSGAVTLWSVTDLARPQPVGGQLTDGDGWPMATLAFSANGRLLAGATLGGNIAVWNTANLSDPQWIAFPLNGGSVGSVAVAPDGRTVAVAEGDSNPIGGGGGTVALWDVSDSGEARQLSGTLADEGTSEAFSPDGKTLAVASVNGTVTLWDVTDPARPRQNDQALSNGLATQFVAYSPRGSVLVTESTNETIQLWNTSIAYAVNRICATTSISPQRWRQYLPQVPYRAPCGG